MYSLRKAWNVVKDEVAPWWAENSKEAYASGLANLADALGNWNASKKGQRNGPKVRFPRFKSAQRSTWSATFTTGAFGLANADRRHVQLPKIGIVRTHESTRKLAPAARPGPTHSANTVAPVEQKQGVGVAVAHAGVERPRRRAALAVEPTGRRVRHGRVEDLNVAGMTRNRTLARHIADAGMGDVRRQLDYKTTWSGRALVVADRFYPSSKTCNDCGVVKAKLALSERVFTCESRGHVADRDLNAARNLAGLASSPSCVNEPAGNPRKTSPAGSGGRHGKTAPDGAAKAA